MRYQTIAHFRNKTESWRKDVLLTLLTIEKSLAIKPLNS